MRGDRRIEWLDIAKGGSMICVGLWHANLFMQASGFHPFLVGTINDLLIPIRMPLFFTISGILATRALDRDWPEFSRRTIWQFVYLFALWGFVRWAYFREIEPNVLAPDEGSSWRELLGMWLTPQSGLWFIWALAIFFVVAKLGRPIKPLLTVAAVAVAVLTAGGIVDPDNYVHRNVLRYMPFFLIGAYFGKGIVRQVPSHPVAIGLAAAATFALVRFLLLDRLGQGLGYGLAYAVLAVSGLLTGCAASVLIEPSKLPSAVLGYIGRNTLPIYVTHVMVISAAVGPASILGLRSGALDYVGAPLLVLIAITLPLLLKLAVERSSVWWLYRAPALPA